MSGDSGKRPTLSRTASSVVASALLAVLVGCAAPTPDPETLLAARMSRMFGLGLAEVNTTYLEPVSFRHAALSGLAGLSDIDPSYTVTTPPDEPGTLVATVNSDEAVRAALPNETVQGQEATGRWGGLAASIVTHVRSKSPTLAAADEETIYAAFFDAVTARLDRFSRYASRSDAAENRADREGFGGIGVIIESHPDGARVDSLFQGEPAAAAGLLPGDRILSVDGSSIAGLPLSRIARLLRGPIEAPVALLIDRDGLDEPFSVLVGRSRIVPNTVFYERMGKHAILRISGFNRRTTKRVAEAVAQARAEIGDALSGLILDLRGNPGGLLEEAVDTADLFLEAGLISRAAGRHPDSVQTFQAEKGDIAAHVPITVLINGATASAAEILASALQDHGRAVVIGMGSFGKGSIQTVVTLPNDGELYLTWAKFVAPSGYSLDRLGVMPTICTSGAADAVASLDQSFPNEGSDAPHPLIVRRNLPASASEADIHNILKLCPWQPHTAGDIDLAVAELLLDSPAILRRALAIGAGGES